VALSAVRREMAALGVEAEVSAAPRDTNSGWIGV